MMLPILISVSVAPMSYFFWSAALTLVDASIARAAENSPNRKWMAGIVISLDLVECVNVFGNGALWRLLSALNTPPGFPARKSPPRDDRGGRHLVERSG